MTHEEMNGLYELYVLGTLDEHASSLIRQHLEEGCSHCTGQVHDALHATSMLSALAEQTRAPTALRGRILASVRPPTTRSPKWMFAFGAVSALALILVGIALWSSSQLQRLHSRVDDLTSQRDDLRGQVGRLQAERTQLATQTDELRNTVGSLTGRQNTLRGQVDALSRERSQAVNRTQTMTTTIAGLTSQVDSLRSQVQALNSQRSEAISQTQNLRTTVSALSAQLENLQGQVQTLDNQKNALLNQRNQLQSVVNIAASAGTRSLPFGSANDVPHGRVFLPPSGNVLFVGLQLPQIPDNQTFQLWLVPPSGAPRSAGLFRPSSLGEAVYTSRLSADALNTAAVAVSIEPRGGSSAPTRKPFIVVPVKS